MSTLKINPGTHRPTMGTILATAGVTIAVAVCAVLLTVNDSNHTQRTTTASHIQTSSPYLPTVQIPAAGTAHVVVDPRTGQAHGTVAPPTARSSRPRGNPDVSNIGHRADS